MEKEGLGEASIMSGKVRELSKNILVTKGRLKIQTEQEKYEKIFDKYTLSQDQL